ncbi:hypothetical protein Y1Q_0002133 [Alligator mississippiensis]|uniref:Uncharacterized protein n=1 Tax=Alligator mississippiensis TaxID=8496 RepID=A0A151MQ02_ALLMI|nr:hypothetical protein Y1Q_0002133 [Alligator mississippiensis]
MPRGESLALVIEENVITFLGTQEREEPVPCCSVKGKCQESGWKPRHSQGKFIILDRARTTCGEVEDFCLSQRTLNNRFKITCGIHYCRKP